MVLHRSRTLCRAFRGRLRHALRPTSIIDLVAILPFFLPFLGVDLRFVRILLLMRMFRLAKVGRYYTSLRLIITVIQRKKEELLLTSFLMGVLLIVSASVMYYCGNAAQPEQFPDIPSTLWWSAITLTTVGYGDVFPVTVMGKVFAALIAMAGIGMFALPTGILGAGFVEAVSQRKAEPHRCPHCGEVIDH